MTGLQCNKFKGDKGKIILVLLIRAMLQLQGEILQVDMQELLNATTTKGNGGLNIQKLFLTMKLFQFLKSLKDIFNVFDKDLLNEITEVQTVFDQMEVSVQQFSVDKKCLEIAKKEILLENDRLLQKVTSQDVLLTVMNSMSLNNDFVNMKLQKCELCEKCLNLDAELSKSK
ncbi:hypothetical protein Tco_0733016 [Tanacetum coccineum]